MLKAWFRLQDFCDSSLTIVMADRFWMLAKCKDCLHNSQINVDLANIISDIFVSQEPDIGCHTALNYQPKSGCHHYGQKKSCSVN